MDSIPRVTRAQPMDALSSQSTVAGYKAAILAAEHLGKFFPMLTTAAGTIPPAKVLVLGAGVAGLQAIATARRLGAVVSAFDVRPVVKEQVESLGASFLELDVEGAEGVGGYAVALAEDQHAREQELIARHAAESDAVITTALIPGRPAPELITESAVAACAPGAVIVDLAAEAGGNCAATKPGETIVVDGVTIVGLTNLPATMPVHASQMYSRNVQAFLGLLVKDGALALDFEDEIVRETCVAHGGKVMKEPAVVSQALLNSITVFVLSVFLGIELISRVPALLHTPLMSGTNAIHGIVLVGAMLIAGLRRLDARAGARVRGGRLRHDQRRRRLPRHRPDAGDVQAPAGAARGARVILAALPDDDQPRLPRRGRLPDRRDQAALLARRPRARGTSSRRSG